MKTSPAEYSETQRTPRSRGVQAGQSSTQIGTGIGSNFSANPHYEWNHAQNYSSTVEGLVAIGISDDDIFGADVSLGPSLEAAYRGTWQTSSPDFSLFWRASYARVEAEVSGGGFSESDSETGFGIGVGATWRGFTLGYTQYLGDLDDINRINFGYRFSF